jgi:fatty acid-binding protein DegV
MRNAIVVHSGIDFADELLGSSGVEVLPCTLFMGEVAQRCTRGGRHTLEEYADRLGRPGGSGRAVALTPRQTELEFRQRLVPAYDYAIVITPSKLRSQAYANAVRARYAMRKKDAAAEGTASPFALSIVDSRGICAGAGLAAWEAIRMHRLGMHPAHILQQLQAVTPRIHTLVVPPGLGRRMRPVMRERAYGGFSRLMMSASSRLKMRPILVEHGGNVKVLAGARSSSQAIRKLLAIAEEQIHLGLSIPCVAISYGGNPGDVRQMPGFEELESAAARAGVELMISTMSAANVVHLGMGALSLGLCTETPGKALA